MSMDNLPENKFPMHDFRVEAHGSIIDVSLLHFFLKMPASEIDGEGIRADLEVSDATVVATCLVLAIQSLMSFRNWSRSRSRQG
ncbi:hypothetical protein ACE6H2_006520 [Prunus campanulata]